MTGEAVLIPFKSSGAKSRLSRVLADQDRREFAELMLEDLLSTLGASRLLRSSFVISSDSRALGLAERAGAGVVAEPSDRGVNAAVARAMEGLRSVEAFMVLPADLPLLAPDDLALPLSLRAQGMDVVTAPSRRFDGTNLLLFSRSDQIRLSYDSNSFWNHVASSAKKARSLAICSGRGLTFDLDTPEDLAELARLRINSRAGAFARKARLAWASSSKTAGSRVKKRVPSTSRQTE